MMPLLEKPQPLTSRTRSESNSSKLALQHKRKNSHDLKEKQPPKVAENKKKLQEFAKKLRVETKKTMLEMKQRQKELEERKKQKDLKFRLQKFNKEFELIYRNRYDADQITYKEFRLFLHDFGLLTSIE